MMSVNRSYFKHCLPSNEVDCDKECFVKNGEGIKNNTSFVYEGLQCNVGLYVLGFFAISYIRNYHSLASLYKLKYILDYMHAHNSIVMSCHFQFPNYTVNTFSIKQLPCSCMSVYI